MKKLALLLASAIAVFSCSREMEVEIPEPVRPVVLLDYLVSYADQSPLYRGLVHYLSLEFHSCPPQKKKRPVLKTRRSNAKEPIMTSCRSLCTALKIFPSVNIPPQNARCQQFVNNFGIFVTMDKVGRIM